MKATYTRHGWSSFELPYDWHRTEVHNGGCNPNGTYIELDGLVYEHRSYKGFFAQRMLTPNAIQSMHADYFDLPDDTQIDTSPNALNQKIKLLEEEVTVDDS